MGVIKIQDHMVFGPSTFKPFEGTSYAEMVDFNGSGSGGVVIQANSDTTVDGWDVPDLTVEQITLAHNTLVSGNHVSVQNEDGDVTFIAYFGDQSAGNPSITLIYYWLGFVDYQINDNDEVTITVHKIPGAATHQITGLSVGPDTVDMTVS